MSLKDFLKGFTRDTPDFNYLKKAPQASIRMKSVINQKEFGTTAW